MSLTPDCLQLRKRYFVTEIGQHVEIIDLNRNILTILQFIVYMIFSGSTGIRVCFNQSFKLKIQNEWKVRLLWFEYSLDNYLMICKSTDSGDKSTQVELFTFFKINNKKKTL